VADGTSFREYLEDVHVELLAWMHKLNAETGVVNLAAAETWTDASLEVKRTLAAQDCTTSIPLCGCLDSRWLTRVCRRTLRSVSTAADDESGVTVRRSRRFLVDRG
jgi:hypothetical protein